MKPSIICIAHQSWFSNNNPTKQLMIELAQSARVLFINPQPTHQDVLNANLWGNNESFCKPTLSSRLVEIELDNGASLYTLQPRPGLPVNWSTDSQLIKQFRQFNARRLAADIQSAMIELAIDQPIVINAMQPGLGLSLKGYFNEQLLLYYCYEEIRIARSSRKYEAQAEETFLYKADAVITTSMALLETKRPFAQKSYLIPKGISFDFFNAVISHRKDRQIRHTDWKARFKTPIRKVVGFVGAVDEKIDMPLLQTSLALMPDTDFWFIGPIKDKNVEKALSLWSNVWLLGAQKTELLPELMAQIDVIIVPFMRNPLTWSADTLFINEFLAAGLPVVSTHFTDLSDFSEVIDISSDKTKFSQFISNALSNPDYGMSARVATAYENDWNFRVKALLSVIDEQLYCEETQLVYADVDYVE